MKKIMTALMAVFLLAGCSSNSTASNSYSATGSGYGNYAAADTAAESTGNDSSGELTTSDSTKKIVYTGSLSIETTDYDASMAILNKDASDGTITIESSSEYTDDSNLRSNYLTIRIPSENFTAYMCDATSLGSVRSQSTNRDDITKQYNDKSITIAALQKEQERLQEMMDQATTVDDMISIESRLSEVETELNQYQSDLANLDNEVAMSTINIQLNEVLEYSKNSVVRKDSTFLDRLKNTFSDSWKFFVNLLETLLFLLIYLIPIVAVALIIYLIIRSYRKKHPKKPKTPTGGPSVAEKYKAAREKQNTDQKQE